MMTHIHNLVTESLREGTNGMESKFGDARMNCMGAGQVEMSAETEM